MTAGIPSNSWDRGPLDPDRHWPDRDVLAMNTALLDLGYDLAGELSPGASSFLTESGSYDRWAVHADGRTHSRKVLAQGRGLDALLDAFAKAGVSGFRAKAWEAVRQARKSVAGAEVRQVEHEFALVALPDGGEAPDGWTRIDDRTAVWSA